MLVIPNLRESPFHRIDAGLSVPLDQLSDSDHENYAPFDGALMARIPGERMLFATIEIGSDETELHAALSLSFDKPPQGPQLAQRLWDVDQTADKWEQSEPDAIWNALVVFLGKTVSLFVEGSFAVERSRLPTQSLVASMIGLRTMAGEEQFLLSGAQFAVRGFPDDTISWYLTPGSYGQKVSGHLIRQWMDQFHWESISDSTHIIQARFNRIVMAQADIHVHAAS